MLAQLMNWISHTTKIQSAHHLHGFKLYLAARLCRCHFSSCTFTYLCTTLRVEPLIIFFFPVQWMKCLDCKYRWDSHTGWKRVHHYQLSEGRNYLSSHVWSKQHKQEARSISQQRGDEAGIFLAALHDTWNRGGRESHHYNGVRSHQLHKGL